MKRYGFSLLIVVLIVSLLPLISIAAEDGLVLQYNFSEGKGAILNDLSGNNNNGKINGAKWVKLPNSGYFLEFDGNMQNVDCGNASSLNMTGPMTLSVWVNPTEVPFAESNIFGKSYTSYALTDYYGALYFYISAGSNNVSLEAKLKNWHHVVGVFDGKTIKAYKNGRIVNEKPSAVDKVSQGSTLYIGTGNSDPSIKTGAFKGYVGDARVYNKALNSDEVSNIFKIEARKFGINPSWFDKIQLSIYTYPERKQVAILTNYKDLIPIRNKTSMVLEIFDESSKKEVYKKIIALPTIFRKVDKITDFPTTPSYFKEKDTVIDFSRMKSGRYMVVARLSDENGYRSETRKTFSYQPYKINLPLPKKDTVGKLPNPVLPPKYNIKVSKSGSFEVNFNGKSYKIESTYTYPYGGENSFSAMDNFQTKCEPNWKVTIKKINDNKYQIIGKGDFYSIVRTVDLLPTHISIKDKIKDISKDDIGIIIKNHVLSDPKPFDETYMAGLKSEGITRDEPPSPTCFVNKDNSGLGIVPLDDVYVLQCRVFNENGKAGVQTDKFALASGKDYTLEWAVYPTATKSYYDFINVVRKVEKRSGTIDGGFAFWGGYMDKRTRAIPSKQWMEIRNAKYVVIPAFLAPVDDPTLPPDGFDFMFYPKEMELVKKQAEEIRKAYPGTYVMFHVAHSEWLTNKPMEWFPDSRVINPDGGHAIWAPTTWYFGGNRIAEGWNWYIYYPMIGNSYHNEVMKSVDRIIDGLKCNAVFMDGLIWGYVTRYTYDKWDGHTADIDPVTKTIKRKSGNVMWMSQGSLLEFVRKFNKKGGVVVANNNIYTRSLCKEKIIADHENAATPDMHLAPAPAALVNVASNVSTEVDTYRNTLENLKWGEVTFSYWQGELTYPSLMSLEFPITFGEIYSGYIKGKERIITMLNGVYGWRDNTDLHYNYKCDSRGGFTYANFLTTVDSKGVRTKIKLAKDESAVIKRIPIRLQTSSPANVYCTKYDIKGIEVMISGTGKKTLEVRNGEFKLKPANRYNVRFADSARNKSYYRMLKTNSKGILQIPVNIVGENRMTVTIL